MEEAQDPARLELLSGAVEIATNQEGPTIFTNSASHIFEDRKVERVDADAALEVDIDNDRTLGQQPSLV
eukprot:8201001-Pyramimonas_sp.AAC.1